MIRLLVSLILITLMTLTGCNLSKGHHETFIDSIATTENPSTNSAMPSQPTYVPQITQAAPTNTITTSAQITEEAIQEVVIKVADLFREQQGNSETERISFQKKYIA